MACNSRFVQLPLAKSECIFRFYIEFWVKGHPAGRAKGCVHEWFATLERCHPNTHGGRGERVVNPHQALPSAASSAFYALLNVLPLSQGLQAPKTLPNPLQGGMAQPLASGAAPLALGQWVWTLVQPQPSVSECTFGFYIKFGVGSTPHMQVFSCMNSSLGHGPAGEVR